MGILMFDDISMHFVYNIVVLLSFCQHIVMSGVIVIDNPCLVCCHKVTI